MAKKNSFASKLKIYFESYNFVGFVIGMLFVYASFTPSLLPRGWVLQGVVSGALFCIGYGLGVLINYIVSLFTSNNFKENKLIKHNITVLLVVLYFLMLIAGASWQNEINALIGQPGESNQSVIGVVVVSIVIVMSIMLISRSIRTLFHWLKRQINRVIPKPIAVVVGFLVTLFLVIGFVNGFLLNGMYSLLNDAFSVRNGTTDEGVVQPSNPELSGAQQSLIAWETLGRQGRNFISEVNSAEDITEFSKVPAKNPVRIYSGIESADNADARASLALEDLKRAGGFDRKVLLVITTTGTGWVDESGVEALEYMYNGDSAMVAMQYSYLPSWLSFLVDQSKAREAGSELYDAIYNEWLKMPEASRPKIVVFGESLGSFGSETAFSTQSAFKATSDGAVWAGPPNFNTLWRKAVTNRDEGSLEILPVVENGATVRFAARPDDLKKPETTWNNPRAVYLQNPSDPIVWWSPNLILNKPDWISEQPGFDVSHSIIWLPFVTFLQVSGDMVFSTGVPDGHGHKYGQMPTDAWTYVVPPEGWTQEKTEELKAALKN